MSGKRTKQENLKEGYGWVPSVALLCTMILNELKERDLSIVCCTNIARSPIHANAFWDVEVKPEISDTPRNSPHQPETCVIYGKR